MSVDWMSQDCLLACCIVVARVLVGFYFVFFVFWNYVHKEAAIDVMRQRSLPYPVVLFSLGLLIELVAGLLVMLGVWLLPAAAVLIVFAVFATFIYHCFWLMDKGPERTLNTIIFIGNLTISLSALLFVIGTSAI